MTTTRPAAWQAKRTDETRKVEETLKQGGFDQVDAYRYNSASIRVRVIDQKFEGKSLNERDEMIEPFLDRLHPKHSGTSYRCLCSPLRSLR